MHLEKVISGGQLGADQAALRAAKECGIETGGWMPKDFMTLAGPTPNLAAEYGMKEHSSTKYPPRTFANVKEADATIRFAKNFFSPGEICTAKAIEKYHKFYKDIFIYDYPVEVVAPRLVVWIHENKFKVINIAGNTPKACPEIYEYTYQVLKRTFELLKQKT